jgi:hypothetical protein
LTQAETLLGHANSCAISFQATGAACRAAMSRRFLQYGLPAKAMPSNKRRPAEMS